MASEEMQGEDMDSLFEGMVLFNPSQIEGELRPDNQQDDRSDDSFQHGKSDALTNSTPASSSCSQSQPLDENLFSDLTLVVTPLQNLEVAEAEHDLQSQSQSQSEYRQQPSISSAAAPSTTTTAAPTSSRRRKRSGLRIGYGRDSLFSNDLHHPPSPLPQPVLPVSDNLPSETPTVPVDIAGPGDTRPSHSPSIATDVALARPSTESSSLYDSSRSEIMESENQKHEDVSQDDETFSVADFRQIKARIHEKLNHARQLVNSASAARKDSIRNRRKAVEKSNLASLRHMELEKQLEEACEAEDFERAEKISENLSAAEKEKQALRNALREADAIIDALDLKLQQALDSQIATEEECAILLEHYATVSKKESLTSTRCKIALFTLVLFYQRLLVYS